MQVYYNLKNIRHLKCVILFSVTPNVTICFIVILECKTFSNYRYCIITGLVLYFSNF